MIGLARSLSHISEIFWDALGWRAQGDERGRKKKNGWWKGEQPGTPDTLQTVKFGDREWRAQGDERGRKKKMVGGRENNLGLLTPPKNCQVW